MKLIHKDDLPGQSPFGAMAPGGMPDGMPSGMEEFLKSLSSTGGDENPNKENK